MGSADPERERDPTPTPSPARAPAESRPDGLCRRGPLIGCGLRARPGILVAELIAATREEDETVMTTVRVPFSASSILPTRRSLT
ncbi:hypothetical protein GCM10022419_044410 [Nonomuraea rosea]|uniref:Uncharacterized protein n=1 Tax=Nonomuraea rosea TaxID=638574 RepID=A0ABP6WZF6_9ACTN